MPEPGPDEEVVVRFGDLQALEADRADLRASVASAMEDLRLIQTALGIAGEDGITAHQLVVSHILPAIRRLLETQTQVDAASLKISQLQLAGDGPEIDLGNGRAMKLVGRRLPPAIANDVLKSTGRHREHRPRKH